MKIGVIGAGKMGQNHIRNLKEIDGIEYTGYYDPYVDLGQNRFKTVEELIETNDAIDIVTPTSTHYETALKCEGKDVFIEKPLSPSIEECKDLKERFKDNTLMVGQIERFSPVVKEIKSVMDEEEVLGIEIHRCSPYDKRIEVSIVDDLMIHDIDLLFNYFTNSPIEELYSSKADIYSGDDYYQIIGKLEDGKNFSITSSRVTQNKIRKIHVHCRDAYITGDLLNGTVKVYRNAKSQGDTEIKYSGTTTESKIILINNLKNELEHFRNSILESKEPMTNVDEAINNMELIKKIKK